MSQSVFMNLDLSQLASLAVHSLIEKHFGRSAPLPLIMSFSTLPREQEDHVRRIVLALGGKTGYYRTNIDGADRVIQVIRMENGGIMLRVETSPRVVADYEGDHPPI
ncbi:hypothetical protein HY479_01580 [Candidatus Uhrbacteria bacterium]|nr:hypothetical protein [Candidatus Uhrbacteria bacterium]